MGIMWCAGTSLNWPVESIVIFRNFTNPLTSHWQIENQPLCMKLTDAVAFVIRASTFCAPRPPRRAEPDTCIQWCHVVVKSMTQQSQNLQARVSPATSSGVTLRSYSRSLVIMEIVDSS